LAVVCEVCNGGSVLQLAEGEVASAKLPLYLATAAGAVGPLRDEWGEAYHGLAVPGKPVGRDSMEIEDDGLCIEGVLRSDDPASRQVKGLKLPILEEMLE
jgi:hypothetical protein